ncbi:MAG: hypothetical protein ABJA98_12450 [Acidobacteriota bacterium]
MRALKGKIPRIQGDHRGAELHAYRAYALATVARFWPDGHIPASARPWMKEAGRIILELDRLAADFQRARAGNRRQDANRIRRQQNGQRFALLRLEDAMAAQAGRSVQTFAEAHRASLAVVP